MPAPVLLLTDGEELVLASHRVSSTQPETMWVGNRVSYYYLVDYPEVP